MRRPVWTPDGRRIVFASARAGVPNLFMQAADGAGAVERLTTGADIQAPSFVAPDGTGVVGSVQPPKTNGDIVWFPLNSSSSRTVSNSSSSRLELLVRTPAIESTPKSRPTAATSRTSRMSQGGTRSTCGRSRM